MYEVFEKLCKGKGVTPYEVSKATGISTVTLTDWKHGRYTPKQDKLQLIAEYFGVPVEYIKTGKMPEGYYANDETATIAQAILESKELRGLFLAAKDAPPEDIEFVYKALLHFKSKEMGEN